MPILAIDQTSPHFATVKILWRANSATLGFLPDGAFADYGALKRILVAIDDTNTCAGYLLYRVTKGKVTIAHLCVDEQTRGKGHAVELLRHLIGITRRWKGIELRCRRDFPAHRLWPKLGFCARSEVIGRSADGHELTSFWLDHGHADLLSVSDMGTALDAALDSNVFIDIVDPGCVKNEESHALLADWLQPLLRLCVTEELFNDIDRQADPTTRRKRKIDAQLFHVIRTTSQAYLAAEDQLRPLFTGQLSPQDESDLRHLIRTVAAGVAVFVTRDERMLNRADDVYARFGLSILRPAEAIARIDELAREREYQRLQVAGTNKIFSKRISSCDHDLLEAVQASGAGEKLSQLRDVVQPLLAKPQEYGCFAIRNDAGQLLAFYIVDTTKGGIDRIPVFRICVAPLAGTLARSILTQLAYRAAATGRNGLLLTDQYSGSVVASACDDLGFIPVDSGWLKLVLAGLKSASALAAIVSTATEGIQGEAIGKLIALLNTPLDGSTASHLEHLLWPVKIVDADIPTFIVAIQPGFARELFDERLARQWLFGADPELALNPESVYYRAAKPRPIGFTEPGRVLWYVSQSDQFEGTMCIRACSRVLEIATDKPKALFKRFRRLGVYSWQDVFATADDDIEKPIAAIRFHDTELFPKPIEWDAFQAILHAHDVRAHLESPARIPMAAFNEIYGKCFA